MKNELVAVKTKYFPEIKKDDLKDTFKIARSELPELGLLSQSSGKGLYKCVFPNGVTGKLAKKDGANLGTIMNKNGIVGQARWVEQSINPTTIFAAAAIQNIEISLEKIEKIANNLLEFEQVKEEANLIGDYNFLIETLRDFELNSNNTRWLNSRNNQITECINKSHKYIDEYRKLASKSSKDDGLKDRYLHTDAIAENKIAETIHLLENYQKAIFLYALSKYAEILVTESFNKKYLENAYKDINKYSLEYRDTFSKISYQLETYSDKSLDLQAISLVGTATKGLGNVLEKTPFISNTKAGDSLIKAGKNLSKINKDNLKNKIKRIKNYQKAPISEIEDNIKVLNDYHRKKIELYYDDRYIYMPNA